MKYWKITTTACLTVVLAACGGGSGSNSDSGADKGSPNVTVESISFSGVILSMNEGVAIGTLAEQQLLIENGPADISNINLELNGVGSEYFTVTIAKGDAAGKYLGNLSLKKSLLGLGGSELNFIATVRSGEQSLSVAVNVKLTVLEPTLPALEHGDVFNKNSDRLGTSQSESGLVIATQPLHGNVEAYYVGNESWDFNYTSTDCFEGPDSYLYKVGNEYGRVAVDLKAVLDDLDIETEIDSTKTVDLAPTLPMYFQPTISVSQPSSGSSRYQAATMQLSYTPNATATTTDSFTYAADGCAKTVSVNITRPPVLLNLNTSETGSELWKTDGTVAGTVLVKDINYGSGHSGPHSFVRRPSDGVYFFVAYYAGEYRIWKTDGTEENTNQVVSIAAEHTSRSMSELILVDNEVYFTTKTSYPTSIFKVWKTDGTELGTKIIKELDEGSSGTGYSNSINGKFLFSYDTSAAGNDTDPWVSDGSELGTTSLKDIWPGAGGSSFLKGSVIEFNGKLFSRADDYTHGSEIWMTDGTPNGTEMLINLEPETQGNREGSIPTNFTAGGDVFYFAAVTSDKGDQLWKSDGTPENTVPVKDMDPNSAERDQELFSGEFFYGDIKQGSSINGLLFFAAKHSDLGVELWKSDGTESGTVMVKDLMLGTNYSSRPDNFVEFNNVLYFAANALDNTKNLWKSDGTEQGTVMVKSFESDVLQSIEVKGGVMLLTLRIGGGELGADYQIWRSDGTDSGTYFLGDIL